MSSRCTDCNKKFKEEEFRRGVDEDLCRKCDDKRMSQIDYMSGFKLTHMGGPNRGGK